MRQRYITDNTQTAFLRCCKYPNTVSECGLGGFSPINHTRNAVRSYTRRTTEQR